MNRNNNPLDTITSALSPSNWLRKLGVMLLLATILAIDKIGSNIDDAFRNGTSWVFALYDAYVTALYRAFGTVYPFILDMLTGKFGYLEGHYYGTMALSVVFLFLLIYIVFQPVSLFFDLVNGRNNEPVSFVWRLLVTLVLVIFISAFIYYAFGDTGIIISLQENVTNSSINSTINTTLQTNTTLINMI